MELPSSLVQSQILPSLLRTYYRTTLVRAFDTQEKNASDSLCQDFNCTGKAIEMHSSLIPRTKLKGFRSQPLFSLNMKKQVRKKLVKDPINEISQSRRRVPTKKDSAANQDVNYVVQTSPLIISLPYFPYFPSPHITLHEALIPQLLPPLLPPSTSLIFYTSHIFFLYISPTFQQLISPHFPNSHFP